ncbi:MAG: LLM class flavin-dependent oxidoreductase [Acidimicrobiales bacterium]
MTPTPARPPLSVLDLSIVSDGHTSADALADTTAYARRADQLGLRRIWVAEHHNMSTVASTSPPVLIAHLAALTSDIRVGSGGVMLPNHPPLVVAEQFAMLDALHPDRIDLGIGRAPGTDPATAAALRRSPDSLGAEDFPRHLVDLMGLLGDRRSDHGLWERFRATPVSDSGPEVWLLGSSDYSAQLAGILGLPFAFAHHFDMGGTVAAVDIYRRSFEPSAALSEPRVLVTASVLAAETEDRALRAAAPGRLSMLARRTGRFTPLLDPATALEHPDLPRAMQLPTDRIAGEPEAVVDGLDDLVASTGADELMLSTSTYSLDERIESLELVSTHWSR